MYVVDLTPLNFIVINTSQLLFISKWFASRLSPLRLAFEPHRGVCDRVRWSPVRTRRVSPGPPLSSHSNDHTTPLPALSRVISIRSVTCFIIHVVVKYFYYKCMYRTGIYLKHRWLLHMYPYLLRIRTFSFPSTLSRIFFKIHWICMLANLISDRGPWTWSITRPRNTKSASITRAPRWAGLVLVSHARVKVDKKRTCKTVNQNTFIVKDAMSMVTQSVEIRTATECLFDQHSWLNKDGELNPLRSGLSHIHLHD